MKVIHCIGSLGFGGIERLVYDLVTEQNKREGLQTAIGVCKLKGEFSEEFGKLDTQLVDFKINSGFDVNLFKIAKISKLFKKFDVVHLHGFYFSVVLAAIWSRKKLIYTEHGNFGFGRKIKASDKLSFALRKLFFKYSKVYIYCNSDFTKRYVETKFYRGKRLKVLLNGSSLKKEVHKELKEQLKEKYKGKFVIGTSSRLAGFKKVDRLINLFAAYIKVNPKVLLVIVGAGVEEHKLKEQVANLKLESNVFFEGYQKEVATYQSIFDIAVFPSINEPFGLVAVECYSKKKPVLVYDNGGGLTEIVSKFEPHDVCNNNTDMISRINYYLNNGFKWSNKHYQTLEFFGTKRMEIDYYNAYCNSVYDIIK